MGNKMRMDGNRASDSCSRSSLVQFVVECDSRPLTASDLCSRSALLAATCVYMLLQQRLVTPGNSVTSARPEDKEISKKTSSDNVGEA